MSSFEFEITIQPKSGESWPVIVKVKGTESKYELTRQTKGQLKLNIEDLTQVENDYLEYGKILGKALFQEEVLTFFRETVCQEGTTRVLLCNESDDDEIKTLYWERLCAPIYETEVNDSLTLDNKVPFSQYIPTKISRRFPPIGQQDLRALVLVASPNSNDKYKLDQFDVKKTVEDLRRAFDSGGIPYDFLANVDDTIGEPSLEQLLLQLKNYQKPYTILHLICHGKYSERSGETSQFLATKDNEIQRITASDLLKKLKPIKQGFLPYFTFMCICNSADPKAEKMNGGLGQRLLRELGMPAVVAMTRKITIRTGLQLGKNFYPRLRELGQVDSALHEATAGLENCDDITVPVLFSRLGGRPLFRDDLENRELNDEDIKRGIGRLETYIQQQVPNAETLNEIFNKQKYIIQKKEDNKKGASQLCTLAVLRGTETLGFWLLLIILLHNWDAPIKKAINELNSICVQLLEQSFESLALSDEAPPPPPDAECPFPGISPFKEDEKKFFFEREDLVKELDEALKIKRDNDNLLAVVGPSGCGKTSLVIAGLIPKLITEKENSNLKYISFRPGRNPHKKIESLKKQNNFEFWVVDQFEELFTLCTNEKERIDFIKELLEIAEKQKVIITMREDYTTSLDELENKDESYKKLKHCINKNYKYIQPMNYVQLRNAIKQQAIAAGLEFEEGLDIKILEELKAGSELQSGAMPLLQYTLSLLWQRRWGRWLCYEEYEEIGGAKEVIAKIADDFYENQLEKSEDNLDEDTLEKSEKEKLVKNIFVRLVHVGEYFDSRNIKRRVKLKELKLVDNDNEKSEKLWTYTKKLVGQLEHDDVRLLVTSTDERTGDKKIEFAHESLIFHWAKLKGWLDDQKEELKQREKVRQAALEWEENKEHKKHQDHLVHKGEKLKKVEWMLYRPGFLNQIESDYLKKCLELEEQERREKKEHRRRELERERKARKNAQRWLKAAMTGFVILSGLLTYAEYQRLKVNISEINSLAKSSYGDLSLDGRKGLQTSLEAADKIQSWKDNWLFKPFFPHFFKKTEPQVELALMHTVHNVAAPNTLGGHGKEVFAVSFSHDGKILASASKDNTIKLWNTETGKLIQTLKGHTNLVKSITFHPTNKNILASAGNDNTVKLWEYNGKTYEPQEDFKKNYKKNKHTDWVNAVSFSPDGKFLASASDDRTVKLWNTGTGRLIQTLAGIRNSVRSVSFSHGGEVLASAGDDNTIKIWRWTRYTKKYLLSQTLKNDTEENKKINNTEENKKINNTEKKKKGHSKLVRNVAFNHNGRILASASDDKTVQVWEWKEDKGKYEHLQTIEKKNDDTGKTIQEGHTKSVRSVSFHHDKKKNINILASASDDYTVKIWEWKQDKDKYKQKIEKEGKTIQEGHTKRVRSVSFSKDGNMLASAGYENTVKLWI